MLNGTALVRVEPVEIRFHSRGNRLHPARKKVYGEKLCVNPQRTLFQVGKKSGGQVT
jgi:hypothetical protein